MTTFLSIVFVVIAIMGLLYCALALIKNENTYKNRMIIAHAIFRYHSALILSERADDISVSYDDMEPYDDTFKRWWDWSYTRLLPSEKFELVKPYIDEK